MKKDIKKFLFWSLCALVIQNLLFIYIDKKYLGSELSIEAEKVSNNTTSKMYDILLPQNAKDIKVSYDGRFISYFDNNVLKVADSNKGVVNVINPNYRMSISYYKWLPDDDLLILAEKTDTSESKQSISFFSYDAEKDNKRELTDFNNQKLKIDLLSNKEYIDSMACSTSTNIWYIKIVNSFHKSDIYMVNVMNEISKVKINDGNLGNIALLTNNTNLIYEQGDNIKVLNKNMNIRVNNGDKISLLATDNKDKLYIGEVKENKITRILFGELDTPLNKWANIKLDEPMEEKNIIITEKGNIFIKDSLKECLIDVKNKNKNGFQGNFIGIYDDNIICVHNQRVKRTLIDKG